MTALYQSIIWVSLIVLGLGLGGLISEESWMQPLCFIPSTAYLAWANQEGKKAFFGYVRYLLLMAYVSFVIFSLLNLPPEEGLFWFCVVLITWNVVAAMQENRLNTDGQDPDSRQVMPNC